MSRQFPLLLAMAMAVAVADDTCCMLVRGCNQHAAIKIIRLANVHFVAHSPDEDTLFVFYCASGRPQSVATLEWSVGHVAWCEGQAGVGGCSVSFLQLAVAAGVRHLMCHI